MLYINNSAEDRHASLSVGAYVAVSSLTAIFIAGEHFSGSRRLKRMTKKDFGLVFLSCIMI